MSEAVLLEKRARQWLERFDEADRPNAAKLLALVKLVPGDHLREEITTLLARRLADGETPVALFNESERRMWKGRPNRLFKEETRANGKGVGLKTTRAEGRAGPVLVPRQRNVDEKIGSEGVMANILTQFQKGRSKGVFLNPGPDTFRNNHIRRFILVTDFIGSGQRAATYLDSAWRNASVRSWWSRRSAGGLSFEVVAYAGTAEGITRLKRHPCQPEVHVVARCPTLRTIFPPSTAAVMEELCERYAETGTEPLGFGKTGALLAFDHGMPNNAPAVFWKPVRKGLPLFPGRTTVSNGSPFRVVTEEVREQERLQLAARLAEIGRPVPPIDVETIVLSALRRSPRHDEALSGRLGLTIEQVGEALEGLRRWGAIDANRQLTERGRLAIKRLAKSEREVALPKRATELYFPESLRMPRDF